MKRTSVVALITSSLMFISGTEAFAPSGRRIPRPSLVSSVKEKTLMQTASRDLRSQDDASSRFDPLGLKRKNDSKADVIVDADDDKEMTIWAARGILLLVAAIWGTNFAAVKYLEGLCFHPPCHHPPSEFALARFSVAALVSFPLLWGQSRKVIQAGLECGAWISLGYITQAIALATISAGKCAFICSLTVVSVPVMALVLYGRPITTANVLAAAIALSGVGVLEGLVDVNTLLGIAPAVADTTATLSSSTIETAAASAGPLSSLASSLGVGKGDLIALGQPLGYGFAFLRIEHYQEKYRDVPNRVLTIAAAQCIMVGLISFLWVMWDYHGVVPPMEYLWEPHRVATILWTGIVTTVLAIFLEGIALQTASATDAAIAFSSEPVWASMFGFLLLREQLGVNAYVGGAIIMMACLVGAISDLQAEQQQQGEE